LTDRSFGQADSWAFLDRRLDDALTAVSAAGAVEALAAPLFTMAANTLKGAAHSVGIRPPFEGVARAAEAAQQSQSGGGANANPAAQSAAASAAN
jgi:hypothetical protein